MLSNPKYDHQTRILVTFPFLCLMSNFYEEYKYLQLETLHYTTLHYNTHFWCWYYNTIHNSDCLLFKSFT